MNLYKYQEDYLSDLPSRAIMAADTGTGKTFMSLAHYERYCGFLKTGIDQYRLNRLTATYNMPLLILAPASKVRTGDWEREITEWFGAGNEPEYEIYSYERFSRNPSNRQFMDGKRAIWHKYAPGHDGIQAAVICDEVHRAKNSQSGIGKAVFAVTQRASFFIGLSATPLPNGWQDMTNYSKIFGFTKNKTEFFKKYVNLQTYKGFPEIVGYHRESELTRQWQSISKRLTKAEANELPPKTFKGVYFTRPKEYTMTMLDRKTADGTILDTAPALAHALRQTLTAPKMDYLSDIIEGTTDNVVIFYNYVSERTAILEMLAKHKTKTIYRQDGDCHEIPAKQNWDSVTNSVTLAHYRSGGTGVEMQYANITVYFSPTYSFADHVQSIGRTHRNGQTRKTTFYCFRTRNSIEDAVYGALSNKQSFQEKQWVESLED